jgi:hypothetical protein
VLEARRAKAPKPAEAQNRGYTWLYDNFITQAEQGCDFSFLRKENTEAPRQ